MSSKACPKTCTQLSTAAVFISVGIIQFLAGIILLKSEYIYLLAVIDFIAAFSNIIIGSFLGISSSIWEKKKKRMSSKSTARQNILAGLYISVMVLNATAAIIMIMGDGNKLLTVPEEANHNTSATFVVEILACAYVTSVCSPIVCLVVALVCLSGNRIEVNDKMKKRESISKTESYGWVYEHENKPKNLSEVVHSSNISSPVSDDNVFFDRKLSGSRRPLTNNRLSKTSISGKTPSLKEVKSPLEIWAQKRKKVLEEITSPKRAFFADDYLQFSEFRYGSYVETILPRIKQTSVLPSQTRQSSNSKSSDEYKHNTDVSRTSRKSFQFQSDEVDTKSVNKHKGIDVSSPNKICQLSEIPEKANLPNCKSILSLEDASTSELPSMRDGAMNNQTPSGSSTQHGMLERQPSSVHFSKNCTNVGVPNDETMLDVPSSIDIRNKSCFDNSNLVDNTNKINSRFIEVDLDEKSTYETRRDFLKSFKKSRGKKSKWSESDIKDESRFPVKPTERNVFSDSSEFGKTDTAWAGELVPIAIRVSSINRASSIPVSSVGSRTSPTSIEDDISKKPLELNKRIKTQNKSSVSEDKYHKRAMSLYYRTAIDKPVQNIPLEYPKSSSMKLSEKKRDIAQRITSMGSIAESPSEEPNFNNGYRSNHQTYEHSTKSAVQNGSIRPMSETNTETTITSPKQRVVKMVSSTNLLKRLWSLTGTEDRAGLSGLIMDADSLVGLSEEELKARTNRIRLLRKSVQQRSKMKTEEK